MTADLSLGTVQGRTQWDSIFNIVRDDICKLRFLYPAKTPAGDKVKYFFFFFSDIQKGREFTTIPLVWQELLQAVLSSGLRKMIPDGNLNIS